MSRNCPSCGSLAESGRYCAGCGADLSAPATCSSCEAALPPDARFCNQCGAPAGAAAGIARDGSPTTAPTRPQQGGPTGLIPWIVAAVAVGALLAVLVVPRLGGSGAEPTTAGVPPSTLGDASAVDISSMTPRERADRLFNRVMQSVSTGDSAQARAFLPMALAAYEQVPDLDLDGRYHAAVLHLVANDPGSARAQADAMLAEEPDHLFGHFTAAQAEEALGNEEAAARHYQRFLDAYDAEIARGLPEYRDHAQVLPVNRDVARQSLEFR